MRLNIQFFGGRGASQTKPSRVSSGRPSRGQLEYIEQDYLKAHQISADTGFSMDKAQEVRKYISYYTESGYSDIRNGGNEPGRIAIEEFIESSPTYNGEIYRGMKFNGKKGSEFVSQLQEGATMDMRGISSWSSDYNVANYFANKFDTDYRILFKVKNKTGVGIKHLSSFPKESEVLQSGKTRFKIKKVIDKSNEYFHSYEVELQEV